MAIRRVRPRVVVAPPEPGAIATPRRSFKKSDLNDDGNLDHTGTGPVSAIEISRHKFAEKFGTWQITPAWDTEKVTFNDLGNVTYEEGHNYKDFFGLQEYVTPPAPWEPSRYKRIYTYDHETQQVTVDLFWAPLTEKLFEYRSRDIKRYKNGERIESSTYNTDGSLQSKTVEFRDANGKKISTWFGADGTKWSSTVSYPGALGDVVEDYDKEGKMTRAYRRTRSTTSEGIVEVLYFYYFSPDFYGNAKELTPSKTVILRDPQSGLELENISYLGAQVKEHRKTEYAFDERGNWIRQVELKNVTKFGKTYFEPQTAILRRIIYRQGKSVRASQLRKKH